MNNVELMQVGNTTDDVFEKATSLSLLQFSILDNVVKQLAILNILHHQKQMSWSLDDLNKRKCTS